LLAQVSARMPPHQPVPMMPTLICFKTGLSKGRKEARPC
jgi:hypothetical protein